MVNGTTTLSPTFKFFVFRSDLDNLAHGFVTDDVAPLHFGDNAIENVQVGTANGAGGYLDNRIAR